MPAYNAGPTSATASASSFRPRSIAAPLSIKAVASTWERNTQGLFDFEARQQVHQETFTTAESTAFVRSGSSIQMVGEWQLPSVEGDHREDLLRVMQRGPGAFWVARASESSQRPWLVVRDLATRKHRLAEGDVMKLGSIRLKVRQLVTHTHDAPGASALPDLRLSDSSADLASDTASAVEDGHATLCRICLCEGSSEDDPLIAPCQCKGSIACVHVGCLRHWVHGRLNLTDRPDSYFYRRLNCELCKSAYATYVASGSGQERKPLVEVPPMQPPFVVLENVSRDSRQSGMRGLHVVSLGDRALKLGRSQDSDVRIADVSISRLHATIHFKDGLFVLEDNNSRFGTFIAMKRARLLEAGMQLSIQAGRTVLKLTASTEHGHESSAGSLDGTCVTPDA